MSWCPWQDAWQTALYGAAGFYRRPEGPAGHFGTSANGPRAVLLGAALARLARDRGCDVVVDLGAGRGELLAAVGAADPGLALVGCDVVARPPALPAEAAWVRSPGGAAVPDGLAAAVTAAGGCPLVVAHEWLDVVPCPVLQVDDEGRARRVEVQPSSGRERLGPVAAPSAWAGAAEDLAWCARWWPVEGAPPGTRVEVGRPRDEAWAGLLRLVAAAVGPGEGTRAVLVAVDYAHHAGRRPPGGTLASFRSGRSVPPLPDGSCDVTAHVALDAVAAAGEDAGAGEHAAAGWEVSTRRTSQREALGALGVSGQRPDPGLAGSDPVAYVRALASAGEAAALLDPSGAGGFGWLVQELRATRRGLDIGGSAGRE